MHSHSIIELADEIKNALDEKMPFQKHTVDFLRETTTALDLMAEVAKEVEHLLNGKISEETFHSRVKRIEEKYDRFNT